VFERAVNGNVEELGSSSGGSDGRLSVRGKTTRRDGTDSLPRKLRLCFPVGLDKEFAGRWDELHWLVTIALLYMWDFLAPGPGTQEIASFKHQSSVLTKG
jgi:hypothetical protein